METNKLFSKLNIKDYNNQLEKILDKKDYSLDVKNLLLSMLYKIENAYRDYKKIKVDVISKNSFIEFIINTIRDKCLEIDFFKTNIEDSEDIFEKNDIIIDKEKGKITCYPNEKSLLSAVLYMGQDKINIDPLYTYAKDGIEKMMLIGTNINQTEIIRDFNGWSWDIGTKEIEDIQYNILYQTLVLLIGKEFVYSNLNIDYINKKNELYEKDINIIIDKSKIKQKTKFYYLLYKITMEKYIQNDEQSLNNLKEIEKEKNELYRLFENKSEFLKNITNEKKQYSNKIKDIDTVLNNKELLKQEYQNRNKNLPNKEKIFSISHLADRLESEREEYLEKIKKCNNIIDPKTFVEEKQKVKLEIEFLNNINDKLNLINYCNEFLKCVEEIIDKLNSKEEIIEWIYKIRYYSYIPFDDNIYLKDVKQLKKGFEKVIRKIIIKAQENKIWDIFTEDFELTYNILKIIFTTKIITLENININCKYENETLYVEYYDTDILENTIQISIKDVKIKKRIKLFI